MRFGRQDLMPRMPPPNETCRDSPGCEVRIAPTNNSEARQRRVSSLGTVVPRLGKVTLGDPMGTGSRV